MACVKSVIAIVLERLVICVQFNEPIVLYLISTVAKLGLFHCKVAVVFVTLGTANPVGTIKAGLLFTVTVAEQQLSPP